MKTIEEQLKELKGVKLDSKVKKNNLDFLLSEISKQNNAKVIDRTIFSLSDIRGMVKRISNSYTLAVSLLLFILVVGISFMSNNTRPGDTFYFARIAKENAKLAMTLDDKENTKLSIKFAGNHARDISDILSDNKITKKVSKKKVTELSKDFVKKIEDVKTGLNKIAQSDTESKVILNNDLSKDKNEDVGIKDSVNNQVLSKSDINNTKDVDDNEKLSISGVVEDNPKMEIYLNENDNINNIATTSKKSTNTNIATLKNIDTINKLSIGNKDSDKLNNLLKEIELLFNQKKYSKAGKKLDNFMTIVDNREIYFYNNNQDSNIKSIDNDIATSTGNISTSSNEDVSTSTNK